MKRLRIITALALAIPSIVPAQATSAGAPELTLIGRGRVSAVYDIEAVPPYAYALERGMLRVLDVRNPAAVREVGSLPFERARSRIALRYPYLYLTGFTEPLGIVDISHPTRPRWMAECPELKGANGDVFELGRERGYLVDQEGEPGRAAPLFLDVLDVRGSPACPRKLARVGLGASVMMMSDYGGIAQENGRAYVIIQRPTGVGNRSELVIVDSTASDTARVVRTVLLPEGKRFNDVEVRGELLFMLESTPQKPNGLAVYRMRVGGDPELIGEALSPGIFFPSDLVVHGNRVYATFKGGSLLVTFDVSNPANPQIADTYQQKDTWSAGLGLSLAGDRLYVTGDGGAAPIFDISAARTPRLLGRWEFEGGAVTDVVAQGSLAVLTGFGGDLFFYDVSKPQAPRRVGAYHGSPPTQSSVWQWNVVTAVRGARAVIAYETRPAQLLDISRPERPTVLGAFTPAGLVQAIALTATDAFLGYRAAADGKTARVFDPSSLSERGGIETVDLRDPRAPHAVGRLELDMSVTDLARHDDHLVAVHPNGSLTVVDIHDPTHPAVLGRLAGTVANAEKGLARPTRIALSADGALAYVTLADAASGLGTLTVVDLRDPAAPRKVGQMNLERSGRTEPPLAVDGNRVAVLLGGTDVLIVDVSDPARPVAIARQSLPATAIGGGLAFVGRDVAVAGDEDGLLIYQLALASRPPQSRRRPR